MKCIQNEYQDEKGQSSCKTCPKDQFSRIGDIKCSALPECEERDFYVKPNPINECIKNETLGIYTREQKALLPHWPGRVMSK